MRDEPLPRECSTSDVKNANASFATIGLSRPRFAKLAARIFRTLTDSKTLESRLVFTTAVILVALVSLVASPLWARKIPSEGDLGWFYYPLRLHYARCLAQGDSFDWMPQLFGGFFLVGEGQNALYHPFHLLIYRWLPTDIAFDFELALPYLLMPISIMFFLRRFIGTPGAIMGGLLFTYSQSYTHIMHNLSGTLILAHLPWVLLCMRAAVERSCFSKQCLACVAIALLTASQIMLGYPQSVWFCLLTEAFFALFLLKEYKPTWRAWAGLVAAYPLAGCVAGVQLLATYYQLGASLRAEATMELKCSFSEQPSAMLGVVAPYLYWQRIPGWTCVYFGAVPLLLVLWWATAHRAIAVARFPSEADQAVDAESSRHWATARRLSVAALFLFVLTVWLGFGKYGKLYYLQTHLPLVGNFRCPCRYFVVAAFALVLIAAIAFARLVALVRSGQRLPYRHLVLPWLAVAASAAAAVWFANQDIPLPWRQFQLKFYGAPLIFGAAALALTLAARGRQFGLFALVILGAVDLNTYNVKNHTGMKPCWSGNMPTFEQFPSWNLEGPPGPCPGRVYQADWNVNQFAIAGYRVINGYAGLEPVKRLDYNHVNTLRAAEVSWYRNLPPGDPLFHVAGLGPKQSGGWCQVPDPLPRARLISNAVASDEPCEDLKKIDVAAIALTARPLGLPLSTPGSARPTTDRPGLIEVEVDAPDKQLLTISENHDLGWRVSIDGRPAEVEQVNGDFLGCLVPAGRHRVRFEFDPWCLRVGKILSLVGLTSCLLLAGVALRSRRAERRLIRTKSQDRR